MPPTKKLTAAETLTLIADRAEALRKAGVLVVQVGEFSAQLAPWNDPGQPDRSPAEQTYSDPLLDPATYPGGRVPGFEREPSEGDPS
jgi:hypothetical protein